MGRGGEEGWEERNGGNGGRGRMGGEHGWEWEERKDGRRAWEERMDGKGRRGRIGWMGMGGEEG